MEDEPRVRDLLKNRELPQRPVPGARTLDRLNRRNRRRPAGNSARLWARTGGDDPFATNDEPEFEAHRPVYASGRFVRLDQAEKEATAGHKLPSAPPAAKAPIHEPPKNIPSAKQGGGNEGKSFRDRMSSQSTPTKPTAPNAPQGPGGTPLKGESLRERMGGKPVPNVPVAKPGQGNSLADRASRAPKPRPVDPDQRGVARAGLGEHLPPPMPPGKAVAAPTGPGLWSTPSAGPAKPKLTASPEGRSVPFVPYTPPQRIVPQNRKPSIAAFNPALPPPKAPQSRPEPIRAPEPARAPEPIRAEPVREIARTPEPTRELPRPPPPPPTDGLDGLFAPPAPPSAPPGRPVGLDDLFGGPSEGRVKIPAAPAEPKKRKVTGGDKPPPAAKPPQQT